MVYLQNNIKKTGANKGFAIVGRNCKIEQLFFGSTFVKN